MDDEEIIRHDVQLGLVRLHVAPKDVRNPENNSFDTPKHIPCTAGLMGLHALYLDDARWAADEAVAWWSSIVEAHLDEHDNTRDAALACYEKWPAGPASNEYLISAVRRYWLACVDECERLSPDETMLPEDFLLATLDHLKHARLIRVLTAMPYWPIGLDENGNWC